MTTRYQVSRSKRCARNSVARFTLDYRNPPCSTCNVMPIQREREGLMIARVLRFALRCYAIPRVQLETRATADRNIKSSNQNIKNEINHNGTIHSSSNGLRHAGTNDRERNDKILNSRISLSTNSCRFSCQNRSICDFT